MESEKQLIAAVALIKNKDGKILLQQRNDPSIAAAHGKWELPGGKVEYNENPKDAAVRECKEEIGCDVLIKRIMPEIQSRIWTRSNGEECHVLVVCYEAEIVTGNPQPMDEEVSDVRWFLKSEIEELDTLVGIEDFIKML
ncbi:NUDIX domain-containing protein [Candidatus Parcubacteria bacterium]|jgi:8-oxo-dGTP diphosphatase|nr:NUDIX domain-containing protein [Candidatus Parcubacteria bacterium]